MVDDISTASSVEYEKTVELLSKRMQDLPGVKCCEIIQDSPQSSKKKGKKKGSRIEQKKDSHTVKLRLQLLDGVFSLLQRQQKEQDIDRVRFSAWILYIIYYIILYIKLYIILYYICYNMLCIIIYLNIIYVYSIILLNYILILIIILYNM